MPAPLIEGTNHRSLLFQLAKSSYYQENLNRVEKLLWQLKENRIKMSAYFPNLTSQQDALQTQYLLNSKLNSYQSSDLPENMMYLNATSATSSNPELFSGVSLQAHDCAEAQTIETREEMLFIAPHGNPVILQPICGQLNFSPNYSDSNAVVVDPQVFAKKLVHFQNAEQNLQHQELSLSLGNQTPSSLEVPSYQNQYANSGLSSLLHTGDNIPQSSELRTAEYFSFDLAGPTNNSSKAGAVYNHQSSIYPKEMTFEPKLHEETVISGAIYNSKYLKAAQELLDEVVNVHQALKQSEKNQDLHSVGHGVSEETRMKSDELSPAERNDLQNKMTKLSSMLDEVVRRYKKYCQQMQVIVSSFEIVAGCGAGKSYTALARQTISRQFRCLRDAIKSQIQAVQQSLGEVGTAINNQGGLTRLRDVDHQLRQQRALLQFGVLRQPWRPQRGLPETAVSILRAWLFEHFLHPYPKDSEKIMLARQTGLTRGQVANWFINARVRLWKPMIEEMYKEEFADIESSPDHAQAAGRLMSESEDSGEEPHESLISAGADGAQLGQPKELRTDFSSKLKVDAYTARLGFHGSSFEEDKMDSDMGDDIRSNQTGSRGITSAANSYNFSMLAGTVGNRFSLALGLQHPVKDTICVAGGTHSGVDDAVAASSVGHEEGDYYCIDAINQQERFSSPHLLSDFVL